METNTPEILIQYVRSGLVEQEHCGFVLSQGADGNVEKIGDDKGYPYYLRSCAKPLQASLLLDYGTDEFFGLNEEEIALCCASHAGESVHTCIAKNMLKKIGLDKSFLKCGFHKPLSKTEQNKLLFAGKREDILQNNCSGKHIMMLAISKMKGWDLDNYYKPEHPLQAAIKNKIHELCEIDSDYPMTKDGCGVPIMSMPLKNMLKGYLNLFCDEKYEKIKNAFLNHPYVIGGEDRTDTKIIAQSENIIAKVGAGGLIVVINTALKEGFLVKITDCDMKARETAAVELINHFGWAHIENNSEITTLHGEVTGEIIFLPAYKQYKYCRTYLSSACRPEFS